MSQELLRQALEALTHIETCIHGHEEIRLGTINDLRAALKAPATAPTVALPKGWRVDVKDDLFKTIRIVAPNGYSAITTSTSRNPENVLRMLVQDLLYGALEDDR